MIQRRGPAEIGPVVTGGEYGRVEHHRGWDDMLDGEEVRLLETLCPWPRSEVSPHPAGAVEQEAALERHLEPARCTPRGAVTEGVGAGEPAGVRALAVHRWHGVAERMPAAVPPEVAGRVLADDGMGTAWPVAPGMYVTCDHVPRDSRDIAVEEQVGPLPGGVVLSDPARDVAVIEVPQSTAVPVPLATVDPPEGTGVMMCGWANGQYAEAPGSVIGYQPMPEMEGSADPGTPVMVIEGPGGPGLSGGPVLADGAVVGHVIGGDAEDNTVYAIPASEIGDALGVRWSPAVPQPECSSDAAMALEAGRG